MSADARILVGLDLGPAHRSRDESSAAAVLWPGMSADARILVDLDLGPAHRSRLTAVSELLYYAY